MGKMKSWNLSIFVSAVKTRMIIEEETVDKILEKYTKLTSEEKAEIKAQAEKELREEREGEGGF